MSKTVGIFDGGKEYDFEWRLGKDDCRKVLDAILDEMNTGSHTNHDMGIANGLTDSVTGMGEVDKGAAFRQAILNKSECKLACYLIEHYSLNVKPPIPLVR